VRIVNSLFVVRRDGVRVDSFIEFDLLAES
jgi:hypothetical protein